MSAKDLYHEVVKVALKKDGWSITAEQFPLKVEARNLFVDFWAERFLIAERKQQKIAVEVKSFIGSSPVTDLEQALGQHLLYERIIQRFYSERTLYLAVRETVYRSFFQIVQWQPSAT